MSVVVDTSVLIDHLRASHPATEFLAGLEARPACSEITRIEILQGLRSAEQKAAARLFVLIEWVPLTEGIAQRAGALGREWRRSYPGIGVADLAIAATALELDANLATRNLKHFPMFKGLRAPY